MGHNNEITSITFGGMELSFDGESYFLFQDNGEGMEISEKEIEAMLQNYYAENF